MSSVLDEVFETFEPSPEFVSVMAASKPAVALSLVGIDTEGQATTPVLGWAETRAAQAAEELRSRFNETEIHARTGCRFHPSYWPAKLLWLSKERPSVFALTKRWLSFADYLMLRLFGETTTSLSLASGTGLLDQRTRAWDND